MNAKSTQYLKMFNIIFVVFILLSYVMLDSQICNAAVYLDGSASGCSDGTTTYNPTTQSCGGGSDTVYTSLSSFNTNIVAGATNYIRAGNYYRVSNPTHSTQNNAEKVGALRIVSAKSGTSGNPTRIQAYPGEERQVVIATDTDRFLYNSNPTDSTVPSTTKSNGSWAYYPNAAVSIEGNYITVDGIKTYGQVVLQDVGGGSMIHDSGIQNSDIGGGGPAGNQGQTVRIASAHDVFVKNNYIHHSCFGDGNALNGSALMGYSFAAIIENNTFENTVGDSVRLKDALGMSAYTTYIRNNLFLPSTLDPSGTHYGVETVTQNDQLGNLYINNNIFVGTGLLWTWSSVGTNLAYNNTFINCATTGISAVNEQNTLNTFSFFNNVFYRQSGGDHLLIGNAGVAAHLKAADYNVYYASSSATWNVRPSYSTTLLSSWQPYSSRDANSIYSNPNFVNASGRTAADFKRTSYAEYFTGSPYGTYAGAYQTGNEVIGATQTPLVTAPNIKSYKATNP
jgi:hypothetical protein